MFSLKRFLSLIYCWIGLLVMQAGNKASCLTTNADSSSAPRPEKRQRTSKTSQIYERAAERAILSMTVSDESDSNSDNNGVGKLEELKQREAELSRLLADIRQEKWSVIRSRPLTIGVMGFGRFGQFISETFAKFGRVVVTSRSDYTEIANRMGVKYVPLSDPAAFLAEGLDVIVVAVSIMSFESTIRDLAGHLEKDILRRKEEMGKGDGSSVKGPLVVDVLSVKEHARQTMLELLPKECDILCTHPMFGPDSGKDSWKDLNFVYEKTRIDSVVLDPSTDDAEIDDNDSDALVEGIDRVERFLSIWEEEGCRMVQMSCQKHDAFAANSQFITHLMGRILGSQGLSNTPIDTKGFESVLQLIEGTTADSFDLFYGLYKYNQNSANTISHLRSAMDDVVENLRAMEHKEKNENVSINVNTVNLNGSLSESKVDGKNGKDGGVKQAKKV